MKAAKLWSYWGGCAAAQVRVRFPLLPEHRRRIGVKP